MISLICCSQYETIPSLLERNVRKTIGTDYEWIWVYNKNNRYSIFEAYNIGVSRAKGEILCFMHQDIVYMSEAWGYEVEKMMGKEDVDACAVAGTDYYRKSPSYYPCGRGHNVINIIQHVDNKDVMWGGGRAQRTIDSIRWRLVLYKKSMLRKNRIRRKKV